MGTTLQSIDKIEAASRQLVTAIRLFFDDRDPISIFSLAQNAREILATLCEARTIQGFVSHALSVFPTNTPDDIYKLANRDRSFFKHADNDPDGRLEDFSDDRNDHVIFVATYDLIALEKKCPLECQVFQTWYFAAYPEKLSDAARENILSITREYFPQFRTTDRKGQKKLGRQRLIEALNNEDLLSDPLTDVSQIEMWR